MNGHTLRRLDAADPLARESYERAFFEAFARLTSNRLVRTLWRWDMDAGRLATRIAYEDQCIFTMLDAQGQVEAAIAVNVAMRQFQSRAFGFEPPAHAAGCFEVLTCFNVSEEEAGIKYRLFAECLRGLAAQGFHTGLATTAPRPLRLYLRLGWQRLAQAEIAGEQRFFLRYDLSQAARAPADISRPEPLVAA